MLYCGKTPISKWRVQVTGMRFGGVELRVLFCLSFFKLAAGCTACNPHQSCKAKLLLLHSTFKTLLIA